MAIEKEHRLTFYRKGESGGGYGSEQPPWGELVANVPATLEFLGGSVQQSAAGAQIDVAARAFIDPGDVGAVELRPDDGVEIVDGRTPGRARFIVHDFAPIGEPDEFFDDVLLLKDTEEVFVND